ncbi:phosphatidylinositol mannoside acyltransferase [Nakamurella endophytica]|uniref:Lipid A biosynthesis lauroyl acyltransferase n=1 Tax=Nakamurella endophytica TaxID=1748367 RepID=A0A917WMB2_9ACTN|nr:phosphatidylinositol mannoside acyltransferase [Nakamurella endophytica]GGM14040.1 lipid A biosynthesis lauroyl acyltransferase [Nakamurella endophytica]
MTVPGPAGPDPATRDLPSSSPRAAARLAEAAIGVGYRAAWAGVRVLPEPVTRRAADLLADSAYRRRGPAVVRLARNLRRVLDGRAAALAAAPAADPAAASRGALPGAATPAELAEVVRAGLRSYARYWLETFRLPAMDHAEVADRALAGTEGLEHLTAARDAGRGIVLALPHSGNWDIAGLMLARMYGSLTSVAERLRPESLYDAFVRYRESLGMEILPLTGGPSASQALKDRLRAGGIVCLLADRDLSAAGIPVRFFGAQTRMPAGPAMLGALTGADVLPVHLSYTPGGWRQVVRPPLRLPGTRLAEQVRGGTQLLADAFAQGIAEHPADWHMLQPLWLADLDPARRPASRPGTGPGSPR